MSQQPRTRREIRATERRGSGATVAIAALVVVVLGAAIWFGKNLFTSDTGTPVGAPSTTASAPASTTPTPTSTPTETPTQTTTPTPTVDPVAANAATCRAGWALQATTRSRAAVVLDEWERHLDIMNDLQAGRITLATAKARWPATTAKAPQHIAAFHAADQAWQAAKKRCVAVPGATTPQATQLAGCAKNMTVVDGILARARAAIEPWETHLKDQSHFKAGDMTATRAEALWRSLWQQGLRLNPPYFAAAKAGAGATCPLAG